MGGFRFPALLLPLPPMEGSARLTASATATDPALGVLPALGRNL